MPAAKKPAATPTKATPEPAVADRRLDDLEARIAACEGWITQLRAAARRR